MPRSSYLTRVNLIPLLAHVPGRIRISRNALTCSKRFAKRPQRSGLKRFRGERATLLYRLYVFCAQCAPAAPFQIVSNAISVGVVTRVTTVLSAVNGLVCHRGLARNFEFCRSVVASAIETLACNFQDRRAELTIIVASTLRGTVAKRTKRYEITKIKI